MPTRNSSQRLEQSQARSLPPLECNCFWVQDTITHTNQKYVAQGMRWECPRGPSHFSFMPQGQEVLCILPVLFSMLTLPLPWPRPSLSSTLALESSLVSFPTSAFPMHLPFCKVIFLIPNLLSMAYENIPGNDCKLTSHSHTLDSTNNKPLSNSQKPRQFTEICFLRAGRILSILSI